MEVVDLFIDKLTVVGKMEKRRTGNLMKVGDGGEIDEIEARVLEMLRAETDAYGYKLDLSRENMFIRVYESPDYSSPVYNWRFQIGGHAFCQVYTGKRQGNDFRLEFNPSKVEEDEMIFLYELLMRVEDKDYTRVDLALDLRADFSEGWEMIDRKKRKRGFYETGSGKLETRYAGTNNSEVQVRFYDKAKEMNRRKKDDEDCYKDWWRIEETIRGDKAKEWESHNWFEGIEIGRTGGRWDVNDLDFPDDMKAQDKASVIASLVYPSLLSEFSKNKRTKVKKMIEEIKRSRMKEKFIPEEYIKNKKLSDLGEIKKSLKKIIEL